MDTGKCMHQLFNINMVQSHCIMSWCSHIIFVFNINMVQSHALSVFTEIRIKSKFCLWFFYHTFFSFCRCCTVMLHVIFFTHRIWGCISSATEVEHCGILPSYRSCCTTVSEHKTRLLMCVQVACSLVYDSFRT